MCENCIIHNSVWGLHLLNFSLKFQLMLKLYTHFYVNL